MSLTVVVKRVGGWSGVATRGLGCEGWPWYGCAVAGVFGCAVAGVDPGCRVARVSPTTVSLRGRRWLPQICSALKLSSKTCRQPLKTSTSTWKIDWVLTSSRRSTQDRLGRRISTLASVVETTSQSLSKVQAEQELSW